MFCDEDLTTYDTNLKLNPPLRSRADMMALRKAIIDGKIDCIASHHFPQHTDDKVCEFEYAKYGMISLQPVFTSINTIIPELTTDNLVDLLCNNAARIFKLPASKIEVGATANLTLFSRKGTTSLTKENNKSKSFNSAILNQQQSGKVIGIIAKGRLILN